MYPIQLPSYDIKLKDENNETMIFDFIRKKYLVLTPEEWVRQHFIHLLIDKYAYPKGLFQIEQGHKYNSLQKRTDILVYNRDGKVDMIVECKAHSEKINQKTLTQAMEYNLVYKAKKIVITNGNQTFCFETSGSGFKQLQDIPTYASV